MSSKNIYATKAYKLGNSGENKVILLLNTFNPEQYNIHNVMLKDGNDTHQIDAICITKAGVFVIEVKNVCGYYIKCENDWTYWTYQWRKNKELIDCKLYNPIWQNKTHVVQIRKILDNNFPVYSVVTFANNNKLVHERPLDEAVVSLAGVKSFIQAFPPKLTEEQMKYIKSVILANNRTDIKLTEHIKNLKSRGF